MRRRAAVVDVEETRLRSTDPADWLTVEELARLDQLVAAHHPGCWANFEETAALPADLVEELCALAHDEHFDPGMAMQWWAPARRLGLEGSASWSWALARHVTQSRRRAAVQDWARLHRVRPTLAADRFGVWV